MRKQIGAILAVGMLSASCGPSTDAEISAPGSQSPTSLPFLDEGAPVPQDDALDGTSRYLQDPVVRDDVVGPAAELLEESTFNVEELLATTADATAGQSVITLVVSAEFEDHSYTTTETVVSDPEQSRTYVRVCLLYTSPSPRDS